MHPEPASRLQVQHVPAGHGFAASVTPAEVVALPDPPVPGAPAGQWWPHPALEPEWVAATDADVVHLHFGFEHRSAAQMRAWVEALRAEGVALVVTVHDLVNPHLGPDATYDALLDVVVPAADALLTLTPGAADEVQARWGRRPIVHPHPHVVGSSWLDRARPRHDGWTVGVHTKSLRSSFDLDAVEVAADVLAGLPEATLRVHAHEDVLDPSHPRHDPRLPALLARPDVRAQVHGPLSDEKLWSDLLDTDLALVPYRFGTHSGWVEMCRDLGTDVLAPRVGHLQEQFAMRGYDDSESLRQAILDAHAAHVGGARPARPGSAGRHVEAEEVRHLHARVYAAVTEGSR